MPLRVTVRKFNHLEDYLPKIAYDDTQNLNKRESVMKKAAEALLSMKAEIFLVICQKTRPLNDLGEILETDIHLFVQPMGL